MHLMFRVDLAHWVQPRHTRFELAAAMQKSRTDSFRLGQTNVGRAT